MGVPYRLRTYAMDQPGLVHRITDLLQRHGINVEELTTRSQPRPETGAPLFSMELLMTVPPSVSIRTVRGELERCATSSTVTWSFRKQSRGESSGARVGARTVRRRAHELRARATARATIGEF